ncbi:MAG: nucleotide pyrophosphohydrolase [Bdellovibrionales bacterium]
MKDSSSSVDSLKEKVEKFCSQRDWDKFHNPKDLAIGVITEASELLEIFRFHSETETLQMIKDKKIRTHIGEELADILCFVFRFSQLYNFDLTSCLEDKLNKNAAKYPLLEKK